MIRDTARFSARKLGKNEVEVHGMMATTGYTAYNCTRVVVISEVQGFPSVL